MRLRATTPMSTIIADDEQLARDELRFLLEQTGEVEIVGTAANGVEALDLIRKLDPSLVFLDIQMPGMDGLSVARRLKEESGEAPHVVFSTAWDQFAVEAFRLEAMDYILKPVERERLDETLARARRVLAERAPEAAIPLAKLLVKQGGRNLIVDPKELIYATIEDGVITLCTSSAQGESSFRTLEELQGALDPEIFWRAHRSYVVNVNRIREVLPWFKSTYQLKMDDKGASEIPVSRTQSRRLREMFNL